MELVRNLTNLNRPLMDCVATIGNFDGFHLGHQAVLKQLAQRADQLNLPVTVLVFEPQPLEYFDPENAPSRLSRWREKYQLLSEQGVDRMVCIPFNASIAQQSARQFVEDFLLARVGVKHLVIGDDFRFGQGRQGDYDLLDEMAADLNFGVEQADSYLIDGERVSSSRIRQQIETGDLATAEALLGRRYSISGRVSHGDKLGRELGFPTANIELRRMKSALDGIFVAKTYLPDGQSYNAIAYIGNKPTLGGKRSLLEVHLFDFVGQLYGQHIKVEFLQKLREDRKFDSFDELKAQIGIDVEAAKEVFNQS